MTPRLALACLCAAGSLLAEEPAAERTPRAGEAVTVRVAGLTVEVPARDRDRAATLSALFAGTLGGPESLSAGLGGGLWAWRVSPESRLRALVTGVANDVRWAPAARGFSPVVTLDTVTLPWSRAEIAEGVAQHAGELERSHARGGAGVAWRRPLPPGAGDNAVELSATFEGGGIWFARGSATDASFVVPTDAWEGRVRVRARADAMERNLLELPHRGWTAGVDLVAARRSRAEAWGAPGASEPGRRAYATASAFAAGAFGVPGLPERHRLVATAWAGAGDGLDRFSAFRLGGGTTWGDAEVLAWPVVPGTAYDELLASRYAVATLEWRFEAFVFLFVHVRGTLAATGGAPGTGVSPAPSGSFPALGAAVTTGLPFDLALELAFSRNFGVVRLHGGVPSRGGDAVVVVLSRSL